MAPPSFSRARDSIRSRPCRPSPNIAAHRSTACRRCSSPNWTIRTSANIDLTSLRTGMMAGAPCPIEVMRRCIRDMHLTEITIGYGMTETSPVSTQTRIGDSLDKQVGNRRPAASACGGQDHRHRWPHRPARRHRRILHPRLSRHARLLGRTGADRRGDRPRRLDAHRRSGDDGSRTATAPSSAASRTS